MLDLQLFSTGICVAESELQSPEWMDDQRSERGEGLAGARNAELTARLWRELLEIDERLHARKNVRLLTPEARVLIHLKLNGPVPVTTAMSVAGTSYRGFYAVLERLKQAELVAAARDERDQRVRQLDLDPSAPFPPTAP